MKQFDLDDFFKNKLDKKQYDFDQQAWNDTRILLVENSKRKRRLAYILGSVLFIVSALVIFVFYYPPNLLEKNINSEPHSDIVELVNPSVEKDFVNLHSHITLNNGKEEDYQEIAINQNDKVITTTANNESNSEINVVPFIDNLIIVNPQKERREVRTDYKQDSQVDIITTAKHWRDKLQELERITLLSFKPLKTNHVFNSMNIKEQIERNQKRSPIFYLVHLVGMGKKSQHMQIGIQSDIQIKGNIGLNLDLGYHWARANNLPAHRGNLAIYDNLSKSFYSSTIEANQFHYLHSQISLSYHPNKNHSIAIGGTYRFLLLTRGQIRKENQESYSTWIVETGLNRSLFSANINYCYAFSNKWSLCMDTEVMLTDVFAQEIPYSTHLSNFKLGLKYRL